jgi:OOP family OmpA-OmpF porin
MDVIGKVMVRHPGSTAVVEGHADKRKKSAAAYNQKLSEKRAQAMVQYLRDTWKISKGRLTAKGYGFSRPLAPNDPVNGNPKNRRVEVYIEGAKDAESPAAVSAGSAASASLELEAPPSVTGAKPAAAAKTAPADLEAAAK